MNELLQWAEPRLPALCLVAALAAGLSLIGSLAVAVSLRRIRRRYAALGDGVTGGNLEALLDQHLARLAALGDEQAALSGRLGKVEAAQPGCVQGVGLVRYDAFENVGGSRSFALALVDRNGDGVVVNSVFGRDASSTYAKPVSGGRSAIPLADEEETAVKLAVDGAATD